MSVPVGYKFRPTDQELVIDYLESKSEGKALPCDVVFEREIYGTGNKALWQIFTENDPWTESSIYVLSKLIRAKGSDKRIARMAGCGSWHGETSPEPIYDQQTGPEPIYDEHTNPKLIGYKRTMCFWTTDESGAMEKGRWIMHEFEQWLKGEYKSTGRAENVEAAAADVTLRKPAERTRRESEEEQKMEAPETETVPYSRELSEAEKEENHSGMLFDMDADLEEQVPMLEQLRSFGLDFDVSVPQILSWLPLTPFSEEFSEAEKQGNYSQMLLDMDADLEEQVPILELE
ncbi:NAC domain-containing protein 41-like [Rhododendron vialii]|uniref:NAC domain-containing protein 41-like n=1 Tax=Rhododendron vialii TaxID=182163 RepID=UPI00265D90F8|nr:NAC domain-containing protein 41-like [Rhododendron vialii]